MGYVLDKIMDNWLEDMRRDRLRLRREMMSPTRSHPSASNLLRIKVQGRRSTDREFSKPRVSAEAYDLQPGRNSSILDRPTVTIGSSRFADGIQIPIKHLTSSSMTGSLQQMPGSASATTRANGPVKAVPLSQLRQGTLHDKPPINPSHTSTFSFAGTQSIVDDAFKAFEKEFDKFTAESKVFSKRYHSRARSDGSVGSANGLSPG